MKKHILQKAFLILTVLTALSLKMYAKKSYDVAATSIPLMPLTTQGCVLFGQWG